MTADTLNAWLGPTAALVLTVLVGLIVGSFLNVVVHRLPRMLSTQWHRDARAFLAETGDPVPTPDADSEPDRPVMNLAWPGSHCPHCQQPIAARDNIPLLGYLLLKGRCRHCRTAIPWRYPALEALSAGGLVLLFLALPDTTQLLPWTIFFWLTLAAVAIDAEHQILPDNLTYPLLWIGLIAAAGGWIQTSPTAAILGAAWGYGCLWLLYQAFLYLTGKEGLGYGDFKLLAAFGAWLGPWSLPLILFTGSLCGLVWAFLQWLGRRPAAQGRLAFGPFLATGALITLIAGDRIWQLYLAVSGL